MSGPLYRAVAAWARDGRACRWRCIWRSRRRRAQLLARRHGAVRRGVATPRNSAAGAARAHRRWPGSAEHGVLSERTLCIHVVQAGRRTSSGWPDAGRGGGALSAVQPRARARRRAAGGAARRGAPGGARHRFRGERGDRSICWRRRARRAALAGLDAATALALCTRDGARALGLEGEIGSLAPGKWGDCVGRSSRSRPDGRKAAGRGAGAGERPGGTCWPPLWEDGTCIEPAHRYEDPASRRHPAGGPGAADREPGRPARGPRHRRLRGHPGDAVARYPGARPGQAGRSAGRVRTTPIPTGPRPARSGAGAAGAAGERGRGGAVAGAQDGERLRRGGHRGARSGGLGRDHRHHRGRRHRAGDHPEPAAPGVHRPADPGAGQEVGNRSGRALPCRSTGAALRLNWAASRLV